MKYVTSSEIALLDVSEHATNDERVFQYAINKKRAEAKLLKGARRSSNLDVEVKSGCVNLRFNDGSFYVVVLPLISDWHSKVGSIVKVDGHDLLIVDVEKGFDKSEKHMDTKLTVKLSDHRYVLHAYC